MKWVGVWKTNVRKAINAIRLLKEDLTVDAYLSKVVRIDIYLPLATIRSPKPGKWQERD
jgi:hypothetical protein